MLIVKFSFVKVGCLSNNNCTSKSFAKRSFRRNFYGKVTEKTCILKPDLFSLIFTCQNNEINYSL
ncbi:hypothetical protein DVG78_16020 [Runella aurantiaca]|uniref:Uncharacterized protein n=1 Tax=Runella aurantiaca TaxID=2282308 RepID=A0A369I857_9BACT|nr:hypothetical protein DVG78_16020 [Runella aurantiaca]